MTRCKDKTAVDKKPLFVRGSSLATHSLGSSPQTHCQLLYLGICQSPFRVFTSILTRCVRFPSQSAQHDYVAN